MTSFFAHRLCCFTLLITLLTAAHSARAQSTLCVATAAEGEPLSFATVAVSDGAKTWGGLTDEAGQLCLADLPTGTLTVRVSRVGYAAALQAVDLAAGQSKELTVELEQSTMALNQVVISGSRYEMDRLSSPVVVGVVSQRNLQAVQSVSLAEGLSFQPGVRLEMNCQNCGFTQVRMNGLEGPYTQILINSRPIFSALNGVYGLEQIPASIIERVEVVRSGGSALYGSNAIAGTINVITREPMEDTWAVGGQLGSMEGALQGALTFNADLVSEDFSHGASVFAQRNSQQALDINGDGFSDITGRENLSAGTRLFYRPTDHTKVSVDVASLYEHRRGGDRLELAPHMTDVAEELTHRTLMGGVTLDQWLGGGAAMLSAYVSGQTTQRDSYYGGLGGGRTAADSLLALNAYGRTEDVSLITGLQLTSEVRGSDVVVLGAEYSLNDVRDNIVGYERSTDQQVSSLGLFGQYEWKPTQKLSVLAGARLDGVSVVGTYLLQDIERAVDLTPWVLSPRLTLMYSPFRSTQLRGGYSRGFRAPQAFNEDLHIASVGGEPLFVMLGPDLQHELSDALTASVAQQHLLGSVQVQWLAEGFYTVLRRPFVPVSTGETLPNGSIVEEVRNGNSAVVRGVNVELGLSPNEAWLFQVGGTWQQNRYPEEQLLFEGEGLESEPDVFTSEFLRAPRLYGFFTSQWQPTEAWVVDLTGTYTGPMTVPRVVSESGFISLRQTPHFFDCNLRGAHTVSLAENLRLEVAAGVRNLFNAFQDDLEVGAGRDATYVYGPAQPRSVFVSLRLRNGQ